MNVIAQISHTIKTNFPDITPEEFRVRVDLMKHIFELNEKKNKSFRKNIVPVNANTDK